MADQDEQLDAMAVALADLTASAAPHDNDGVVSPGRRPCPICGQAMEPVDQHRVSIDVCADHGVWLDQGELAQLLESVYRYRRHLDKKPAIDFDRHRRHTSKTFAESMRQLRNTCAI